ncbi:hypothetical protein HanRHA438_Chr09g0374551 [Helianthus annuus]|nr:hypothetical protein HanRHA438_Chr09g0374551 [Helianthus annuus]
MQLRFDNLNTMKIKNIITYKRTPINDSGRRKNSDTPWGNLLRWRWVVERWRWMVEWWF